jgi:DOPA 4,5-dioxygenase
MMTEIVSYHAHVYFDEKTVDQARAFCEKAAAQFGVEMGRVHERPVGPHPIVSVGLHTRSIHGAAAVGGVEP